MNLCALMPVTEGDTLEALRGLLAGLLRRGVVDALLVQRPAPGGGNLVHAVISRPEDVADAEPVAPVMPAQAARLVSALTAGGAPYRLGAVFKPCELRATIELAKLRQVDLSRVLLISVDCPGTYEVGDYSALVASGADPSSHALANLARGEVSPLPGAQFRAACRVCERALACDPTEAAGAGEPAEGAIPDGQYMAIGLLGLGGDVLVMGPEGVIRDAGRPLPEPPQEREEAGRALVAERIAAWDRELATWRERVHDAGSLVAEFGRCVRCHNCMVACPLCYCKECLFRGATFDHPPLQYEGWLQRRGAVRLPADTLLFHLTRLNHMAASCVGCGACESACPNDLPLATLFRAVGHGVQGLFGYTPGASLRDELPLASFREDELPGVAQ